MLGRRVASASVACVALLVTTALGTEPGSSRDKPPATAAADLVRRALLAECAGDDRLRSTLLEQAALADPDFAPARWHSGQMQFDGSWYGHEQIAEEPLYQRRITAYWQRRATLTGSLPEHVALAKWCRDSGLFDLEQLHWLAVLQHDPKNKLARSRLKVSEFQDMLVTREEIVAYREHRKWFEAKEREWKPHLERWRRALTGGDSAQRQAAEQELAALDDVGATPFLARDLAPANKDCAMCVVDVLGRLDHQLTTNALLGLAVFSEYPEARAAASTQLGQRSFYAYVPTLMGSLSTPIELTQYVDTSSGSAFYGWSAFQEGPTEYRVQSSIVEHRLYMENPSREGLTYRANFVANGVRQSARDGQQVQQQVRAANAAAEALNQRIYAVLEQATRQQLDRRPQEWWQWWQQYNELEQDQPRLTQHYQTSHQHFAQYSCFLPGTLVWTDLGARPIELIRIGDRVLAQHPESGEISYKLVLNTTRRSPSPTLRIGLGDEEIATTRGHPIWVVGKGWKMAKELSTEDRLHGIHGSRSIEYIEPGPEAAAHNLVVAGFHTYTVGKHRILVHDNTARRPTKNLLPGLAE